jgi:hypothetical protein
MLDAKGYDVSIFSKGQKRSNTIAYITRYCDMLGIKRHEIGIFPADRAVMAYQGKTYSVGYENYQDLATKGVDIVCVEKEGIVEKLAPFTEGVGIALVQSGGFMVEVGEMLMQEARHYGANVMLLNDFDAEGVHMAFSIEGITRLGINASSIDEINVLEKCEDCPNGGLDAEEFVYLPDREDLQPKGIDTLDPVDLAEERNIGYHWTNLDWLIKGFKKKDQDSSTKIPITDTEHEKWYQNYLQQTFKFDGEEEITYIAFLKDKRIELNTIMNEIGPKRFWNWLYSKMVETFPTRDYNRAIRVPPYSITLPIIEYLNEMVETVIERCIEEETQTITDELSNVRGLLDTDAKIEGIHDILSDIVNEDDEVQKLTKKVEALIKSLDEDGDDDN